MSLELADATTARRRVHALHALNVLDTPREQRYDRIVRLAQRVFDVPMVAVNLIDADRQWTKAEAGLDRLENTPSDDSMCRHTVERPGALIVTDTTADDRFRDNVIVRRDPHVRFYAGQPLEAPGGERIGSLCLLDTRPRALSDDEQTLLREMAGWVERELALQHELDRAAQVQQVLMPSSAPRVDGYELAGRCVPTQAIGGDFFAWHLLDDEQLQLHVADVMGKGIPAALIAASVRAVLVGAAQFNDQHKTFARVAVASQELLSDTDAFVTAFSARLDPATGRVQYVDAGHGLAFVFTSDGYRRLERSGPPLGVFPDDTWDLHSTVLEPGETLVVVSDGFLDFFPSLEETLDRAVGAEIHHLPVAELVDRAVAFARTQGHPDDVTVVALRRTAPDARRA
ncbi:PP2C family protein-serine/threonine phosphatase [Kocuria arenosa]|uniref:PP2C family protein-serine/threonine phosphatase n=1 Tax=Kocuria arenosa TaxID=3071446 RepID=UPI0034D75C01